MKFPKPPKSKPSNGNHPTDPKVIRAILDRAQGYCECGCGRWIGHDGEYMAPHHALFNSGRRKQCERVETVFALYEGLTHSCHKEAHLDPTGELLEEYKRRAQRNCMDAGMSLEEFMSESFAGRNYLDKEES